jgi:hypothetical protein
VKLLPLVTLQVRFFMPEKSADVAVYVTRISGELLRVAVEIGAGQVMLGATVSVTLTVKTQVLLRLALSVAEQPTVVLPRLNVEPVVMLQELVFIPEPSVTLFPVYATGICGLFNEVAMEIFGQTMVGGIVSSILIENEQEEFCLMKSMAVHENCVVVPSESRVPDTGEHVLVTIVRGELTFVK